MSKPLIEVGNNKRNRYIKIYVFDQEKAAIEKRAKEAGKTSSDFLRSCGLEKKIVTKPSTNLVSIRLQAENLKNHVLNQKHLAVEAFDQRGIKAAENLLSLIDTIILTALK